MKYVKFDEITGILAVELPAGQFHLKPRLQQALQEVFLGEPENNQTAARMDDFVARWLAEAERNKLS